MEKTGHQNISVEKIQRPRKDPPVCLYSMWDVIKMSDVALEAINPVSTMVIFIASRLLRKKLFETLFTMVELKEAYHTHVHTPTHPHTHTIKLS